MAAVGGPARHGAPCGSGAVAYSAASTIREEEPGAGNQFASGDGSVHGHGMGAGAGIRPDRARSSGDCRGLVEPSKAEGTTGDVAQAMRAPKCQKRTRGAMAPRVSSLSH